MLLVSIFNYFHRNRSITFWPFTSSVPAGQKAAVRFYKGGQWIKADNKRIFESFSASDGTCSLIVTAATPDDAGKYTLVVKTPTEKSQKSTNIDIR